MKKQITISAIALFVTGLANAQTLTFDALNAIYGYPKPITWYTSNWGAGFGHKIYNDDYSGKTYLKIAARHNNANFTDALTVSSDGLVGIGTNAPTMKLELSDANTNLSLLKLRNNGWACNMATALEFWNGSQKNYATSRIVSKMDGCGNDGEALVFETQTAGQTWTTPKMTIRNNGQVWIGQQKQTTGAHTNYRLAVDGKLVSKEIIVTAVNWADFVFDPQYKLKPLDEVEKFYQENKHLPEIPTTAEITENGNDLGKTDALLLQKIEELTMYLVEQNKRNEKQQAEIAELRAEIKDLKNNK